jgi:hypothetical protein
MPRLLSARFASLAFVTICAAGVTSPAEAQAPPQAGRLRVHIESCDCFTEFLRSEIRWVDFVRNQQDADVQVLSTSRATGAGGVETVLRFVGGGRFAGVDHELRAATPPGEPEDVRRRDVLRTVLVGLLGLSARDGLPADLRVTVTPAREATGPPERDPWNYWIFRLGGDASLESEESSREETWAVEVTADRITDNWRISLGVELETQKETFDLNEVDEDPFTVTRRERQLDWFIAKALGSHWSFGIDGDAESSTFGNVKVRTAAMPAIEFNVFPYEDYASRQLRFEYGIGVQHSRYTEVTLFDRLRETRPLHELSVTLDQREPWGTLQAAVQWSQYLHDVSRSRLEVSGNISLRVARGLSFDLAGQASRIRDQLSLPRRGATPEEVLLRVRELGSGHEVNLRVGLTYSFGSIFNNIVNPRFGRN